MQIEDNIRATLNGITPNVMSLKGWVLALLSGGAGVGCSDLTDAQIKCSDSKHNKVIRECDMSVGGVKGWIVTLCQSPSSPLSVMSHAPPWENRTADKYLFS